MKDDCGNTPLHEAASVGRLNAFRYGIYENKLITKLFIIQKTRNASINVEG